MRSYLLLDEEEVTEQSRTGKRFALECVHEDVASHRHLCSGIGEAQGDGALVDNQAEGCSSKSTPGTKLS